MGEGPEQNPFAPPAERADHEIARVGYDARRLASYGQRFAGLLVDWMLYVATWLPGSVLVFLEDTREREKPTDFRAGMILAVVGPLLLASYQWYRTATTGQSLAKRWLGMRVVHEGDGTAPGFVSGVLLRSWLFIAVTFVPCGFAALLADALTIFSGDRRQTLHDRVARTIVVEA